MIEKIFWISTALLLWPWVLYPAVAALLAWLRPQPVRTSGRASTGGVTVIIAARNEAAHLPAKLASLVRGGLDADRLEVIVVDDGSDDATADVARAAGARVLSLPEPRGKAVALSTAREAARHDILVLTDARQPLAEGALALLLAPFADPRVGAVSGQLSRGARGASGIYRRFDDLLRRLEARTASTIGVTGALWAVRKSLFASLPEGLVLDDVYAPMEVVRARRRVVIAPEARALELPAATSAGHERRRRVRTLAGNLDLIARAPWLLVPGLNPLWGRFMSHKLARLLGPFALVAVLGTLAVLMLRGGHWLVLGALAGGALLLAALGRWAGPPGRLARAFVGAQVLCALAWIHALSGRTSRLWRPAPNPGARAGVSHGAA